MEKKTWWLEYRLHADNQIGVKKYEKKQVQRN
jgi:hypothetical protein